MSYTFATNNDPIPLIDVVVEKDCVDVNGKTIDCPPDAMIDRSGLVLTNTQNAINYLYNNGLTKFNTEASFMASNSLRRDEAAAFFARFARDVLGMMPDTTKAECDTFTDASSWHADLQSEMIAACQLWLFRWSNGLFAPTASFTNAQALTVLIRLFEGTKPEIGTHRAINYYNTAKAAGLTASLSADAEANLDANISRWDVAKLIEAWAYKNKVEHWWDPHENINGVTE
jgi:hypothetical protein